MTPRWQTLGSDAATQRETNVRRRFERTFSPAQSTPQGPETPLHRAVDVWYSAPSALNEQPNRPPKRSRSGSDAPPQRYLPSAVSEQGGRSGPRGPEPRRRSGRMLQAELPNGQRRRRDPDRDPRRPGRAPDERRADRGRHASGSRPAGPL